MFPNEAEIRLEAERFGRRVGAGRKGGRAFYERSGTPDGQI